MFSSLCISEVGAVEQKYSCVYIEILYRNIVVPLLWTNSPFLLILFNICSFRGEYIAME